MSDISAMNSNTLRDIQHAQERIHALEGELTTLQRRLEHTLILNRIIAAVAAALEPIAAFEAACTELAHTYAVPQVALAVLDPTRTFLDVVAEYCAPDRTSGLGEQIAVANNPLMDLILADHAPLVIPDTQHDPRLSPGVRDLLTRRKTASLLIIPVLIQDKLAGTIGIDAIQPRAFTVEEITLAQHVSLAMSQALHNAQLHAAVQQELAERKRAEAIIKVQAATLAELSTPLIPLTKQVLLLPLIGAIDAARAQQITETLLSGVVDHTATTAIIDITGLSLVDTYVATTLIQTAQAVRLLGATVIITGVRPEVAQTLVSLGIDLHRMLTFGSLQSGITHAMQRS